MKVDRNLSDVLVHQLAHNAGIHSCLLILSEKLPDSEQEPFLKSLREAMSEATQALEALGRYVGMQK